MVKPTAKITNLSKFELTTLKLQKGKRNSGLITTNSNILSFPSIRYYSSTDLILKKYGKKIISAGLLDFLKELGLSLEIAKHYFYEVDVYNSLTQEKLKALGFLNEDEGFELINPFFKGTIGTQAISFIRGTVPKPESIHIFQETLDFLSFLTKIRGKKILADTIILHSNSCVDKIDPYIQNYGYKQVYSWTENSQSGSDVKKYIRNLIKAEEGLKHKAMDKLYKPFKNVQTWYQHQIRN